MTGLSTTGNIHFLHQSPEPFNIFRTHNSLILLSTGMQAFQSSVYKKRRIFPNWNFPHKRCINKIYFTFIWSFLAFGKNFPSNMCEKGPWPMMNRKNSYLNGTNSCSDNAGLLWQFFHYIDLLKNKSYLKIEGKSGGYFVDHFVGLLKISTQLGQKVNAQYM